LAAAVLCAAPIVLALAPVFAVPLLMGALKVSSSVLSPVVGVSGVPRALSPLGPVIVVPGVPAFVVNPGCVLPRALFAQPFISVL